MARKTSRFLLWQKVAAGVLAAFVLLLLGYLYTLVLLEDPQGEYVEGEHYLVVDNPRRIQGDEVEVMEFFSYGCIFCYNFEDELTAWVADNSERVDFVRTPAVGNTEWRLLARTFYALEEMEIREQHHDAIFNEIHQRGRRFATADEIISFLAGRGVNENALRAMMGAPVVDRRLDTADQLARRLMVASVPTVVVDGKYVVRATRDIGPSRMIEITDFLVTREQQEATAEGAAATPPSG